MKVIKARITIICMSLIVMGLLPIMPNNAEIDPESIVGAWLFDEGRGDITEDFSGNGNDGKIVGAKWVQGKFGRALEFDGKDDWVEVPMIGTFDEITITAWVNSTGRVGQWRVIFNNNGWKKGDVHHQFFPGNCLIEFSIHSNNPTDTFSNFAFTADKLNRWHHLATVYSSTKGWVRFYIDGQFDKEQDYVTAIPAVVGPARIGSWDGGGREWQGMLDEIIIFNVALTDEEIQGIMNNGLVGTLYVEPTCKVTTIWGRIKAN